MGVRTLSAAQRVRLGLEVPSEVVTPARALRTSLAATASNPLTIALVGHGVRGGVDRLGHRRLDRRGGPAVRHRGGQHRVVRRAHAGVALAGRRLGDRSLQAADTVAGLGLVGFGTLLGVRTLRDG